MSTSANTPNIDGQAPANQLLLFYPNCSWSTIGTPHELRYPSDTLAPAMGVPNVYHYLGFPCSNPGGSPDSYQGQGVTWAGHHTWTSPVNSENSFTTLLAYAGNHDYEEAVDTTPGGTVPQQEVHTEIISLPTVQANAYDKEDTCDYMDLELSSVLVSDSWVYEVQEFLGSGAYGQVTRCLNAGTGQQVAIKVIKESEYVTSKGREEMAMLEYVSQKNIANIINYHHTFVYKGHMCLVFDLLEMSMRDYFNQRNNMSHLEIRLIIKQLAVALKDLKSIGVAHVDIKPENIMMVDLVRQPYKLKIIDFGCACKTGSEMCASSPYLQTRYYRCPEMILGLPFNEAADMWSLGCIMAELLLGFFMYPGDCEYDQIRYITDVQGLPPVKMLDAGSKSDLYFNKHEYGHLHFWRLKSTTQFETENVSIKTEENRTVQMSGLDDILKVNKSSKADAKDKRAYIDLLKKMFQMDPEKRITPSGVLEHQYLKNVQDPEPSNQTPTTAGEKAEAGTSTNIGPDTAQSLSPRNSVVSKAPGSVAKGKRGRSLTRDASQKKRRASKRAADSSLGQEPSCPKAKRAAREQPCCSTQMNQEASSNEPSTTTCSASAQGQRGKAAKRATNKGSRNKAAPYSRLHPKQSAASATPDTPSTGCVPSQQQVPVTHSRLRAEVGASKKAPSRTMAAKARRGAAPYMKPERKYCHGDH